MKKVLKVFFIFLLIYFMLYFILSMSFDEDTAFVYSTSLTFAIVIVYNIIGLINKISKYNKNEKVSDVTDVTTALLGLFSIDKGISSTLMTTITSNALSKEARASNKVLLYTNIFLHLGVIIIMFSLICELMEVEESTVSIILTIGLLVLCTGTLIPITYGSYKNSKWNNDKIKELEEFNHKHPSNKVLLYDKYEYKKNIAPKNIIIGSILVIISLIISYNIIFNQYVGLINFLIASPVVYLIYISMNKTKLKFTSVILEPLSIIISPPAAKNIYNSYEHSEEEICFEKIVSYKITKSKIIIYGNIKRTIIKYYNEETKEKTNNISAYKLPRIFANEEKLINVLNKNINN